HVKRRKDQPETPTLRSSIWLPRRRCQLLGGAVLGPTRPGHGLRADGMGSGRCAACAVPTAMRLKSQAAQWETRMTLPRISLVVMCLAASNLLGQTVQFVDDSPSGSPVSFHGTITFPANSDEATCDVTGHNNSPKAVVAYMLEVHIARPTGE